jgi:hypothetical protein
MKTKIDIAVCICLMIILYINLASLPERDRVVRGTLIKVEVK